MKTAIVILSDPRNGDEALGRVFNALLVAHEGMQAGGNNTVEVVFSGAGTRWPEQLAQLSHPVNALYNAVRSAVKGASRGCATQFGATDGVKASGLSLLNDKALAGSDGVANVHAYLADGWQVLIF